MASRRKKRKQADQGGDPLGGFSAEQLLGLEPISEVEKKPSAVGKAIVLPFKLVGALIKAPLKVVKAVLTLPLRILRAMFSSKSNADD